MLRLSFALCLVCIHARPLATEPSANPLVRYRSPELSEALRLGDTVRTRFSLAAAAAPCEFSESLYGYHLLLDLFGERGRAVLESAASEGTQEGRSRVAAADPATCEPLVRTLRNADRELLVLAERAASRSRLTAAAP